MSYSITKLLTQYRLPTLHYPIYTQIPAAATPQLRIAAKLPTQIGLIYGLSIDAETVGPQNQTLITTANANVLYMTLFQGSSAFILDMRLSNLIFNNSPGTTSANNSARYLEQVIPGTFSLDQSYYSNPAALTAGTIKLNLWYITRQNVNFLVKKKVFLPIDAAEEAMVKGAGA